MTVPKYPEEFPLPERTGISGTVNVGLRRTAVPVALANQRKAFNAPTIQITMRFAMDNDTADAWMKWIFDIDWRWFRMNIVSPHVPVDIMSHHQVRLIGPIGYEKRGDNWVNLVGRFEVLQNDAEDPFAPTPEYDWIVANSPAFPPSDFIVSGPLSDPPLPVIISHLYYY